MHPQSLPLISLLLLLVHAPLAFAKGRGPQPQLPESSVALITSALGLFPLTREAISAPDSNYFTGWMGCGMDSPHSVSVSNDTTYVPVNATRYETFLWDVKRDTTPTRDEYRYRLYCHPSPSTTRILAQHDMKSGAPLHTIEVGPSASEDDEAHFTYRWVLVEVEFHVYAPFGFPQRIHYASDSVRGLPAMLICSMRAQICTSPTRQWCLTLDKDYGVILKPLAKPYPKKQLWALAVQPYPTVSDPRKEEAADYRFMFGEADDVEQGTNVPQS
ncbi:hypothetical protein FB451DRAFT_1367401 [Mycena latifolia]|nr:hypothetical protein FB451DRAFT_1367401 [Mycena latifolia]